ncbi:amidohydrolase [Flavihumibacter sp. RY-1]|uniref:Amidohydrolase n=1 Tax=Flavihumibacter fluminis TaxID=2909236 RepID=A0ABS9BKK8_9BACT|nr:amidohydrolase [Flavihumibacter fluminis]MCF1715657.1 amidohydrolase [Flavihumibacter fluminis]
MRFLLLLTALLICSQLLFAQNSNAPTLILFNGKIWTGNDAEFVEAIAITGNTITHIGSNADIKKLAQKSTQLIDLNGQLATAGINDAHTHFLSGSMGLTGVDLYQAKTLEEALSAIEKFVKDHPNKKWITGMGWQYNLFEGGMPNKEALIALDKISPDRPIVLDAYDGHSIWVNSKAMELAGISSTTQFDGFGSIIKDPEGKPTGAFTEAAGSLVEKIVPPPTTEEKLEALRIGMKYAARLGITSIQNASGSVAEFQLYETLLKQGELTLRSSTAFSAGKNTKEEDIQQFIQVKNRTKSHPLLKAVSIKFMLDGVIESHTSPMLEPYSDALPDGTHANSDFALPLEKYQSLLNRFDKEGFQIYTHAIGDRTVREALNAYEKAHQTNGTKARRHRIEHIEQCNPQDVPRFAKLGVMASMQPIHADPGNIEVWAKAVGEKRIPHAFMWKSMLKNKVHLVFSSDWPACTTPDPIRGLHIAVNRQTPEGHPPGGWVPEQRITIQDALKAYTQGGAYSSFEENSKGKLQPGYLADIIVFNQDLFSIPAMDIAKTKVVLTLFDGKIIFNEN